MQTTSDTILPDIACDICGTFFTPTSKRNILCPDCQIHPEQKRKYYANQTERNKRIYDTLDYNPKPTNCEICGKEFLSFHNQTLCSKECRDVKRIKSTFCNHCHKPMAETNDQHVTANNEKWFCSDTCKEAYKQEQAKERGYIHTCKFCGKKFIKPDKNAMFCNKTCYNNAIKAGYRRTFMMTCINCKKQFNTSKKTMFCSDACETHYNKKNKITPAEAYIKNHKTLKKPEPKQIISLCADCRTPYPDCTYMQSNFRVKPKGAKYQDSKIVSCSYYTPPKTKKSGRKAD